MAAIGTLVLNDELLAVGPLNFDEVLPLHKEREWSTDVVTYDGRSEQRNQLLEQPQRFWYLNYGYLEDEVRTKLIELWDRARGQYYEFLYTDRDDYECSFADCTYTPSVYEIATQLIKNYHLGEAETWQEVKTRIVPGSVFAPIIKVDGVTMTEGVKFTLDDTTGIIDWYGGSDPLYSLGAGEVLTANYQFYYRVRFGSDVYVDLRDKFEFSGYSDLLIQEVMPQNA